MTADTFARNAGVFLGFLYALVGMIFLFTEDNLWPGCGMLIASALFFYGALRANRRRIP